MLGCIIIRSREHGKFYVIGIHGIVTYGGYVNASKHDIAQDYLHYKD